MLFSGSHGFVQNNASLRQCRGPPWTSVDWLPWAFLRFPGTFLGSGHFPGLPLAFLKFLVTFLGSGHFPRLSWYFPGFFPGLPRASLGSFLGSSLGPGRAHPWLHCPDSATQADPLAGVHDLRHGRAVDDRGPGENLKITLMSKTLKDLQITKNLDIMISFVFCWFPLFFCDSSDFLRFWL